MTMFDKRGLEPLPGKGYDECLRQLSLRSKVRTYFEVGVASGSLMSRIICRHAVGVDPRFILDSNVATRKGRVSLYQMTSDDFFKDVDPKDAFGGTPDLAFLDGMHLFEFLLRDFYNTEALCSPDSIITMHDCLPRNALMAHRDYKATQEASLDTAYPNWWTGDVWKVVPILQKYRPDLTIVLADAPPTGLIVITGLNPRSCVLKDRYTEIVAEFSDTPNDFEAIQEFTAANTITPSVKAVQPLYRRQFGA